MQSRARREQERREKLNIKVETRRTSMQREEELGDENFLLWKRGFSLVPYRKRWTKRAYFELRNLSDSRFAISISNNKRGDIKFARVTRQLDALCGYWLAQRDVGLISSEFCRDRNVGMWSVVDLVGAINLLGAVSAGRAEESTGMQKRGREWQAKLP